MPLKTFFDIFIASICLLLFSWAILILLLIAHFDTGKALFSQERIGQHGKPFRIFKIRTMHVHKQTVSPYGKFLRKTKLDELPQLLNVLLGQMSFVGPRPDIPGYYDTLQGEHRKILELKPGLTSEASLKYYNEESILEKKANPQEYNDTVIFPDKVKMNLEYYYKQSFGEDMRVIYKTILVFFK